MNPLNKITVRDFGFEASLLRCRASKSAKNRYFGSFDLTNLENSRYSEFSWFWGPRARKWGPYWKIGFFTFFWEVLACFPRYLDFPNFSPLKSLYALKTTYIRGWKIFPSRLLLKSGSKLAKIGIFPKNLKIYIKIFQNPCRSSKSA